MEFMFARNVDSCFIMMSSIGFEQQILFVDTNMFDFRSESICNTVEFLFAGRSLGKFFLGALSEFLSVFKFIFPSEFCTFFLHLFILNFS